MTAPAEGLHLRLADRVPGQLHAIAVVAQRLRQARDVQAATLRPAAAFLFAGAPDTGQDDLAQALADLLCAGTLKTIDARAYRERRHVAALQGALAHAVRRNPRGVVLIDGIDRAHPDALALFLRIAHEGALPGAADTIVIATADVACAATLLACPDSVRIVPFVPVRAANAPHKRQPKETSCSISTSFSYPSALPRSAARTSVFPATWITSPTPAARTIRHWSRANGRRRSSRPTGRSWPRTANS
jgi:AAA domain (Cdc48 subfamily)